MKHIPTLTP